VKKVKTLLGHILKPYISDFNHMLKIDSPEKIKSNKTKKLAQSDKWFSSYRALKNYPIFGGSAREQSVFCL